MEKVVHVRVIDPAATNAGAFVSFGSDAQVQAYGFDATYEIVAAN